MLTSKSLVQVLFFGLIFWSSQTVAQDPNPSKLKSIESLDLNRYLGHWFEIAKFPNWFQKKCKSDTKANYALKSNGHVEVLNVCRMEGGQITEAVGEARLVGEFKSAKLKVRFAPEWMSILPFVWGDYWVIDLDDAYQLVAVSEPRREYLWILSRTPEPDDKALNELMLRLISKGFDLTPLERTSHKQEIPIK
jgi:apolipoprotein D and lipocalin family protein